MTDTVDPDLAEALAFFADVADKLAAQDNAITADPIFGVVEEDIVWGLEDDTSCDVEEFRDSDWDKVNEENVREIDGDYYEVAPDVVVDEDDHAAIARLPKVTKVYGLRREKFVTACLTRDAAEAIVQRYAHNMKKGQRFVFSGHMNPEWKALRKYIPVIVKALRRAC